MTPLPEVFMGYNIKPIDFKKFTELCYMLERYGKVQVKDIQGFEYPKNYYSATFQSESNRFNMYMNCYCSYLAFGVVQDEGISFIQNAALKSLINSYYPCIYVVPMNELSKNIQQAHIAQFSHNGRAALKVWLPLTMGEALFSWFFD
ncbi:hypothetical protein A7985_04555 [Pseudoalteromonas luteoviolacea]|uniref:Uncharacterized protein n=1 Tax=Pseudoalteromonas luteoviolacea TaxID=43657 RepID=A0A1C0TV68_9GAMM|nr:hypothetical protein [Pseudoalteromonas luteoviolacea]MBQ4809773.1 hypothetical protein [Pseudoalteromonas luteoviolacea]OCQ23220.1 hypothetical protein A7985_04555 [Pseudoalteromonas luteoviolacea]